MAPKVRLFDSHWHLPQSKPIRIGLGILLVAGGLVGFLPVLGFWMIPLGLLVLSHDLPIVQRWRRQLTVWWHRKKNSRLNSGRRERSRRSRSWDEARLVTAAVTAAMTAAMTAAAVSVAMAAAMSIVAVTTAVAVAVPMAVTVAAPVTVTVTVASHRRRSLH